MNIAMLIAGGTGSRMKQEIPKQFLNVNDKPVIVYTMESFQNHPDIDAIAVVCLDGWQQILEAYARQFQITKLRWIAPGGENGQASSRNGIMELKKHCSDEDIVLIHDAIRPLVSSEIISDCIAKCRKYGNGVAAMPCQETIIKTADRIKGSESIPRSDIMRVQTPQAYTLGKMAWAHEEALRRGITDSIYANTMLIELGETLYFSYGSDNNIKITTMEDLDLFKALLRARQELNLV